MILEKVPAMEIYELLKAQNEYEIRAYDPHVKLEWVEGDLKQIHSKL